MRILLTGATGFLGNNLLRMLLDDGHGVTVTVRRSSDLRPLKGLEVETVECDLSVATSISSVVGSVDLVIHSAAMIQVGWSKLDLARRVNVEGTRILARQSRLRNIRMIHVSTVDTLAAGTESKPATEYDIQPSKTPCTYVVSKREAEIAFAEQVDSGLDGVIVNPGFMVGPWDWKPSSGEMLLAVGKQFTPLAPSGGCSVVDVRDVAAGIISAIENGRSGENYILAGENLTYFELWKLMAQIANSIPPIGKLPSWVNRTAGRFGDFAARLMKDEPVINSAAVEMGSLFNWYSSDKARSELGYQIGSIEDALADAWDWFQANGYA